MNVAGVAGGVLGVADLTFSHKQFKCMNEFGCGSMVYGFGIKEDFFFPSSQRMQKCRGLDRRFRRRGFRYVQVVHGMRDVRADEC